MDTRVLLNETLEELETNETMTTDGGIDWAMVYYNLYGAFTRYACAYPIGLLEVAKYQPQSGVCTA